jgi:uncharacterized protein (DUF1697 family)
MRNDRLRSVVEGLGHTGVTTVIASDNVVFDSTQRSRSRSRLDAELDR